VKSFLAIFAQCDAIMSETVQNTTKVVHCYEIAYAISIGVKI